MSVLITGAGLVGCQVASRLVQMGEKPVLFDVAPQLAAIASIVDVDKAKVVQGDVMDPRQLAKVFESEGVDRVIHTVALFGLTRGAQADPFAAIKLNMLGTANVLEVSRLKEAKRVVLCSSKVVYQRPGLGLKKPLDEDFRFRVVSGRSPFIYATTKLMCEQIGLNYCDAYGLEFAAVRYGSVFGPWKGLASGHGEMLLTEAIELALSGSPVTLDDVTWFSPQDMVYSKDAALGAVLACYAPELKSRVYNIGCGQLTTLAEIAREVLKALGLAEVLREKPASRAPSSLPPMAIDRARTELGYRPEYPPDRGAADYAAWVKRGRGRP